MLGEGEKKETTDGCCFDATNTRLLLRDIVFLTMKIAFFSSDPLMTQGRIHTARLFEQVTRRRTDWKNKKKAKEIPFVVCSSIFFLEYRWKERSND